MNKPNNLDSFNSASPLFSDLADKQAAQVSGGFVSEINLSDQQAQGLLGDSFDSDGSNPNLFYGLDLGGNGVIEAYGVALVIASRSRSR